MSESNDFLDKPALEIISSLKKRIVINGRFLLQDITGVQRVERELLKALDALFSQTNCEPPLLLLPGKGKLIHPLELKCVEMKRVGFSNGHLWEQLEFPLLSRGNVILCLGNTAPIFSLLDPKSFVLTMVHDLSYKYFPSAYSRKFRCFYSILIPQVLRLSSVILTVSNAEKCSMQEHYPYLKAKENFYVLQNGGVPDNRLNEVEYDALPKENERLYGIYVGSLSKRKNADGVIRAATKFLEQYPKMMFYVLGANSDIFESFDIKVPSSVSKRLKFFGQINDQAKVYELLSHARFLLFPSFYEASPLPPIEAMTFGTPVICSPIPSLQERCEGAAVYANGHGINDITDAIDLLMTSSETWTLKSKQGFDLARKYSWRSQALKLLSFCE